MIIVNSIIDIYSSLVRMLIFQQIIGIPTGTNCAPLLADIFLYSYEAEFIQPFISQLIRYSKTCSSYECFILRAVRLSNTLLGQEYVKERLRSSLRKFYGRYGDLIKQYEVPLSRMLHDLLDDDYLQ